MLGKNAYFQFINLQIGIPADKYIYILIDSLSSEMSFKKSVITMRYTNA